MSAKFDGTFDYHDTMIMAHAVVACLAALITAPLAILIGRYFRTSRWWFRAHMILQYLTFAFVITVFTVGVVAVHSGASHTYQLVGPKADVHHDFGLAILVLFTCQFFLGVAAHYTHSAGPTHEMAKASAFPTLVTPKHPLRHLHVFCGVVMTALLYAAVKTGLDEWNSVADSGTLVPKGIVTAYWVLFGIEVAAYCFGWVLEPIRAYARGTSRESSIDEKIPA